MVSASPHASHPSDLLAAIAAAMARFTVADGNALFAELDTLDPGMDIPDDWAMGGKDLCADVQGHLGGAWPVVTPTSIAQFAQFTRQLQRLDRWHAPTWPTAVDLERSTEHEAALDRLAISGRFNSDPEAGAIIPRESPDSPFLKAEVELKWDDAPSTLAIVNSLMDVCAYLPPYVSADDPDDESRQNTRRIRLDFRRFPVGSVPLRQFRNDVRVAVAPVLERATDARLWVKGGRYSVHPRVSKAHLAAVVRTAIAADADLLLMPEMSVDEALLNSLRTLIVKERQAYYNDFHQLPRLAFIICGVLRKRCRGSQAHRNYVAVLDADGSLLLEQDKLSHWNLGEAAQARFGILGQHPVPLLEDTKPGTSITIAELPALGRLLTLICADISANEPGDWVADTVGVDWLHAPIMDGSTCWTQAGVPWAIRRAERTARAGTAAVITNSMSLTYWNNVVIQREAARDPTYPYRTYTRCGIALALLPQNGSVKMQHITESIPSNHTPVVHVIDWSGGWVDLP